MAKKKYLDQTRFPKVVTEGYEKGFKTLYKGYLYGMAQEIKNKMESLIKK